MATRFGAASPAQTYAAKVRWLVGCLIAVILVLVVTLIFVAQGSNESAAPQAADQASDVAYATPVVPTADILVASQRIEAGTALMPFMFQEQAVHQDRIPDGAVLARDKASIAGKFAKSLINANLPLLKEDVTDRPPISAVTGAIPPGYRAVTITVDARSGVEGWAQPNTRVDVLWTYKDRDASTKVATIVHFSKILSVGGVTGIDSGSPTRNAQQPAVTTVTLLVTELDAKKIELARQTGVLSLSLVGEKDTGRVGANPEVVDLSSLLPRAPEAPGEEPAADGVMYSKDPVTGKMMKYELKNGRWGRVAE
ncbi:MAG: Flp pilus assembly protein CpaB [Bdellovibrionales bacterium]|nr:Flp pilus assembly protein CpaB [Bdellovibrionales bacterium]